MQKLNEILDRPTGGTATPVGVFSAKLAWFFRNLESAGCQHRLIATGVGLAFIGAVGWINLKRTSGLNFQVCYLLACALVGWTAGRSAALICAFASAILMFFSEAASTGSSLPVWILFSNSMMQLVAFTAIAWTAAKAGSEARNLEHTIEQRTARLQKEIAEHKDTSELLREAIQLFRQVTENIADAFWVTDPLKRQVEYVSPGFELMWGRSCQALYDSPSTWMEGIHHEDRERITRAIFTKQTRSEYDEEYRVVRPDGSLRWVHERAFPVKDESGAIYRLVGIAEDITERKRAEQLMQAERDIGGALSSTSNLRFALERLLEIALQLEGIDCGGVYLLEPATGELHLEAHRGLSAAFLNRISHYKSDAIETRLARSGRVTYVPYEQIPRSLEVLWGSEGLRALALVPVRHKGAVLGMLNLGSYRQDEIPPRTRTGVEMIATQLAGAIARIRAEESKRRSEAHVRTVINSAPLALLAVDAQGTITFEDGQALNAMGVKPGEHLNRSAAEVYRDFPLMLENNRRALAGEEFSSVVEFASVVLEYRFTPLRDRDKKFAGYIAVATDITERLRLQREILEISDREQARLGQDVHDGLCQQIVGVAFSANSLEQSLSDQQRPEAATARKVCALLDKAIDESRRVCRGLYPIRLSTQGLLPALEELALGAREKYGVHCVCESDGQLPACDVATATHLYRIAQEAVNNALRHSNGRNIWIRLNYSEREVVLEVKDDGKGIEPSRSESSGMGLHMMDYRARLIGASLHLTTNSPGTVVSCRVPQGL